MSYLLKYYPINTNNTTLSRDYFSVPNKIYFIPTFVIDILNKYAIDNSDDISKSFIENYFSIVQALIQAQFGHQKRVSSIKLARIKNYKFILNLLTPELITSKINYSTESHRCFEYKLNLSDDNWSFAYIENAGGNQKFEPYIDNRLETNHPCNNSKYKDALINTEIDVYNAIISEIEEYNITEPDILSRSAKIKIAITKILAFSNRRFIKKGKNVDRVYNSFTILSKVARKHIRLNGLSFTEIDIPNCQPLLLLILLNKYNIIPDTNYEKDVLDRCLYERIMEHAKHLGYKKELIKSKNKPVETFSFEDRKQVKILSYRSIYFKLKKVNKSKTAFIFKQLYPKVYDALDTHPQLKDGKKLAFHLQNLEAEIILNVIPNCAYYTVHDSIAVINSEEVEFVKNTIRNNISYYLNNKNIPELSVTPLNNDKSRGDISPYDRILTSPIIINGKYKKHKSKRIKYNKFKSMIGNYTRSEITLELNISSKTYLRYLEEYNGEVPVEL